MTNYFNTNTSPIRWNNCGISAPGNGEMLSCLSILEHLADSVMVLDHQFRIVFANKAACQLFGYLKQELEGMYVTEQLDTEWNVEKHQQILQTIQTEGAYQGETLIRRKDGTTFSCECKLSTAVTLSDNSDYLIVVQRDISEKQQMLAEMRNSHDRFMQLARQSRVTTWEVDANGLYTYISDVVTDMLGYLPEEVVGKKHFYDLFDPAKRELLKAAAFHVFEQKQEFQNFHNTLIGKHGETVVVATNGLPILDELGNLTGYSGADTNITSLVEIRQSIVDEKEKFKTTLLSVGDAVIATDSVGHITLMNPAAEKLTGWALTEAYQKSLTMVCQMIGQNGYNTVCQLVQQVLGEGKTLSGQTGNSLISRQRKIIPIEDTAAPIKDSRGRITGMVIVIRDILDKKEKQEQIDYLSFHDPLTGLFNRRYMEKAITRLDQPDQLPLSVLIIDINGLKLTNDAFGHDVGDQLLQMTAQILQKACRTKDPIGRWGGDEFCVLLTHTGKTQAQDICRRILREAASVRAGALPVSLAVGFAVKMDEKENLRSILADADHQMYKDKLKSSRIMRRETVDAILDQVRSCFEQEQEHGEQVSHLSAAIASAMELPEREIEDVRTAGLLHDIGKIVLPPELVNKKEPLDDKEYESVQRHAEAGYQILKSIDEYVKLAEAVLYHHERWDGKGYPEGLKADEIPLSARILTVADAYAAMTGSRSYKPPRSQQEALRELQMHAGSQFDPEIIRIFTDERFAQKRFPDNS